MTTLPLYLAITAIIVMIVVVFFKIVLPMDKEGEKKRLKKKRFK
jgi:hypothetical protein